MGRSMKLNRGRFMNLITKPHVPTDESTSLPNLFDSTDQWRSLFERSTLGVAMIDSEFHFLAANPAFLTMFGYSCKELQRLSFLDICIDETLDKCWSLLRELSEGVRPHYEIETQHRRKDGTFLPVNTYFSAVSERRPNQRRFLTVTVDISARRAAEDALRVAQSELGRVARLTTAGAIAAIIAHEINQPLAAICSERWCRPSLAGSSGPKSRRSSIGVWARRERWSSRCANHHEHSGNVQKGFWREISGGDE